MREKTIFIIPGFAQRPTNKAYKEIARILKSEGYFPVLVTIPWRKSTISQNSEYFLKVYKKIKARKKYILGFSYGAMIAFIASTKVSTSGLILCSLSPYFKEDIPKTNKNQSLIMTARYDAFSKLHCAVLAKKIKARRILMLYGAQEAKPLIRRVTDAFDQISTEKKHLIRISETKHEIGDKRYLNTIHQATRELL
ncbi:hypothetical protein M1146_01400 [Patescibacteria group bacterium]|nr:hypothetical protein [Patescibacteria group bacterium]